MLGIGLIARHGTWKPVLRDSREILHRAIAITLLLSDPRHPRNGFFFLVAGKQRLQKSRTRTLKSDTVRPNCFFSSKDSNFPLIERKVFPAQKIFPHYIHTCRIFMNGQEFYFGLFFYFLGYFFIFFATFLFSEKMEKIVLPLRFEQV